MLTTRVADARESMAARMAKVAEPKAKYADEVNLEEWAKILEQQMRDAAKNLDFERAALLRDELLEIRVKLGRPAESTRTN
jgi:excinuclease ABC subunit B